MIGYGANCGCLGTVFCGDAVKACSFHFDAEYIHLVHGIKHRGIGCVKEIRGKQIAIFNFERRNEWYACQNVCPHKMEMVLSRGMTGSTEGIPKIACPMHKKTFSLVDGSNLNGEAYSIATYPVKIVDDEVFVGFLE